MPTSWSIDGGPQQLALAGLGLEQAAADQRVVHLRGEQRDVLDVRHVGLVLDREVAHGGLADVGEQRIVAGEQRAAEEHAVAQAGLGGLDALRTRRARGRSGA